jgi:clan AA aspartic protease (TIGR02281 family)
MSQPSSPNHGQEKSKGDASTPEGKRSAPRRRAAGEPAQEPAAARAMAASGHGNRPTGLARAGERKKSDLAWLPWAIGGAGAAVVAVLGGFVLTASLAKPEARRATASPSANDRSSDKPAKAVAADDAFASRAVLLLGWPEDTRKGAKVLIDDEEMVFPAAGKVSFALQPRPQPYRIAIMRPGYEKIEFSCTSKAGEPIEPYIVTWTKLQPSFAQGQAPPAGRVPERRHLRRPRWDVSVDPKPATPKPEKPGAGSAVKPKEDSGDATKAAETAKAEQSGPIVPASRPSDMPPEDFLKKYGLVKSGQMWVLEAEKKLPATLNEINRLKVELTRKRYQAQLSAKKRGEAQKLYNAEKLQQAKLERLTHELPVISQTDVDTVNAGRARVAELKIAAEQAVETADRNLAVANTAGDSLAAKVAKLREYYDETKRQYAAIAAAAAIATAVADYNQAQGGDLALGPTSIFHGLAEQIKGLEAGATAMSGRIPIQRKGQLWCVRVEINGKKTIEMAIDTGAEIVLLSWKAAVLAGLDPESGQPVVTVSANGSKTTGRKLTISKLTVGKFTATDVDCVVEPAEIGDIMPLLGLTFLGKFNFHIDTVDSVLVMSTADEKGVAAEKSAKHK